jgi:hypothetical protein
MDHWISLCRFGGLDGVDHFNSIKFRTQPRFKALFWPHVARRWRKCTVVVHSAPSGEVSGADASLYRSVMSTLRLSTISQDATGLVFFGGANGSKVTWLSLEGVSIVLMTVCLLAPAAGLR